jgi:hypothetical protein
MMFVHDAPPAINFAQTIVSRNLRGSRLPFVSMLTHRPTAVAKATSSPQVTSTSWKANETDFSADAKNVSQEVNAASFARFRFRKSEREQGLSNEARAKRS